MLGLRERVVGVKAVTVHSCFCAFLTVRGEALKQGLLESSESGDAGVLKGGLYSE